MHNLFKIFVALVIFTTPCISQHKIENTFIFPIEITPKVSGSFAELRSNHFHSGIDIGTSGKTGYPIKAMESGVVSRIKVSPVGYGNAIYIKHNNGYTTVYGHLEKYSSKIDTIITRAQYKKQSFSIDYFPDSAITIKQGEIIGFSGNSGSSGGPHLHYEIRDTETEEPLNPFLFQNIIKDDVRPQIQGIRIYPMNDSSRVNGKPTPATYSVVFYDGQFHLKGNPNINVKGKVGIAIKMMDYMTDSWKKCGVYQLDMYKNNEPIYGWNLFRFSFYESRYINSHIDYAYRYQTGNRYQKCFREPNNHLSIYKNVIDEGVITVSNKDEIKLIAQDAAENKSELSFTLYEDTSEYPVAKNTSNIPTVRYDEEYNFSTQNLTCYIPKGALYKNNEILISKNNNIYKIGSADIPLQKAININITSNELNEHSCLATLNSNNKTSYAGGSVKNNTISISTKSFGKYIITEDTIPPTISLTNVPANRNYSGTKIILAKIGDNYSGIKQIQGYIDNKWVLFEYDPKQRLIWCHLNKAPISNNTNHELKLTLTDNCNNETTKSYHFSY